MRSRRRLTIASENTNLLEMPAKRRMVAHDGNDLWYAGSPYNLFALVWEHGYGSVEQSWPLCQRLWLDCGLSGNLTRSREQRNLNAQGVAHRMGF